MLRRPAWKALKCRAPIDDLVAVRVVGIVAVPLAVQDQTGGVEEPQAPGSPGSPSEILKAEARKTKRMAAAGAWKADTDSCSALSCYVWLVRLDARVWNLRDKNPMIRRSGRCENPSSTSLPLYI